MSGRGSKGMGAVKLGGGKRLDACTEYQRVPKSKSQNMRVYKTKGGKATFDYKR